MKRLAIAFLFFLLPSAVFAAGFAKQSLFLSRSPVTEGETVLIHAVVANDATAKFSGSLNLTEAGTNIGSVPVSLAVGESTVVSVSWKPASGSHTVLAELKAGTDVIESQSATFTIAAKPVPATPQAAAPVESSANIQQGIASFSPAAASTTAPLFTLVDGGRAALSGVIDTQIANTKKNLNTGGATLGAETFKNAGSNPGGTLWTVLQTLYLYLLTLLNFIISNAGVFYPVAALLILYALWRLIRRARRPAWER